MRGELFSESSTEEEVAPEPIPHMDRLHLPALVMLFKTPHVRALSQIP